MVSQKKTKKSVNEIKDVVNEIKEVVNEPVVNEPVVNEPVVNEQVINEIKDVVNEPVVNEIKDVVNEPVVNEIKSVNKKKVVNKKKAVVSEPIENVNEKTENVNEKTAVKKPKIQKGGRKPKVSSEELLKKDDTVEEPVVIKVKKTNFKKSKTNNVESQNVIVENDDNDDGKSRSFKVKLPNDNDFSGRFTGLTPYQAANKALSKFFRTSENNNIDNNQILFRIKESTRGSKRHEYTYKGTRIKLEQPITYTIKSADGNERIITKQYKNQLIKVKKSNTEDIVNISA
jgi:hypothetical protein